MNLNKLILQIHNNTIFPAFSLHIYSPPPEHKVTFYT